MQDARSQLGERLDAKCSEHILHSRLSGCFPHIFCTMDPLDSTSIVVGVSGSVPPHGMPVTPPMIVTTHSTPTNATSLVGPVSQMRSEEKEFTPTWDFRVLLLEF